MTTWKCSHEPSLSRTSHSPSVPRCGFSRHSATVASAAGCISGESASASLVPTPPAPFGPNSRSADGVANVMVMVSSVTTMMSEELVTRERNRFSVRTAAFLASSCPFSTDATICLPTTSTTSTTVDMTSGPG